MTEGGKDLSALSKAAKENQTLLGVNNEWTSSRRGSKEFSDEMWQF